jgi:PIN domain nuclease of toxin-antitoxin system
MRPLLDTHVFLWYITADAKLPAVFRAAIQDPANEVDLSAASVWEAVIKHGLGKLTLPGPPGDYLPRQRAAHGIASLPVDEEGDAPASRPTNRPARGVCSQLSLPPRGRGSSPGSATASHVP